jgi:hypothetical protein
MFRDFRAGFLGMFAIIQTDAINGFGVDRGEEFQNFDSFVGDFDFAAHDIAAEGKKVFSILGSCHACLMGKVPQAINFHWIVYKAKPLGSRAEWRESELLRFLRKIVSSLLASNVLRFP